MYDGPVHIVDCNLYMVSFIANILGMCCTNGLFEFWLHLVHDVTNSLYATCMTSLLINILG